MKSQNKASVARIIDIRVFSSAVNNNQVVVLWKYLQVWFCVVVVTFTNQFVTADYTHSTL